MKKLFIMCGLGFSGKSVLARKIAEHFEIPVVSQDALFFENQKLLDPDLKSSEQWRFLLDMCLAKMERILKSGKSVIFDNVNLKKEHRDELREVAKKAGAEAVVIYLKTPEIILNKRQQENKLSKERHDVKQEYLDEARKLLEVPGEDENTFVFTPKTKFEDFLEKLS